MNLNELNNDTIRQIERASIRSFMEQHAGLFNGRVLDYGCGKQPYRDLVSGEYFPYDQQDDICDYIWIDRFDVIICNQVMQYLIEPSETIASFKCLLKEGGRVVITYPTSWAEVEEIDLWRFTKAGMEHLLKTAGFMIETHERRAEIDLNGFKLALGYGVIAQRS